MTLLGCLFKSTKTGEAHFFITLCIWENKTEYFLPQFLSAELSELLELKSAVDRSLGLLLIRCVSVYKLRVVPLPPQHCHCVRLTERLSPRRVSSWFTKGQWELSRQSSMLYWREDGGKHTHGGGGVGWRKHSWGWAREIRSLLNHHGRSTVSHQILLITRLSMNVFCDSAMLLLLSTG